MNKHHHIIAKILDLFMQSSSSKFNADYGELASNEHFLERATDALSVIKISNSFLKTTLGADNPNARTMAAFQMIEKAVLKIEAFLDNTKNQKHSTHSSKISQHTSKSIKKKTFPLSEVLKMSIPKNLLRSVKINLPKNDFEILGDFYKLVVVITNLIQNSTDAIKGDGVINILAREIKDFVVIEVEDSGPGIPTEVLNKVFSSLITTKVDGTGLGLKMAKTIVEAHGGSVSARNNPTTISIKLPKK